MEFRIKDVSLEVDTRGIQRIGGYINVTERESEMLFSQQRGKWFKETMQKGVFQRSINKSTNIPLLLEHDWNRELANTANGTLELREDNIGLRFDATIDDANLYEEIRSGKINSCSFGFKVNEQEYQEVNSRLEKRYVKDITLLECSLVKNPAYVGSLVESRALEDALKMDEQMTEESQEVVEEVVVESTEEVEETRNEETDNTVEENAEVEESTEEVVVEEEVSSTVDVSEEERTIDVDTTSSDVKNDAKEVIQEVIDQKEQELEGVKTVEGIIEEIKQEEKEQHENVMQNLEEDSYHYASQAMRLQLEILKLKEIKMNL